MTYRKKSSGDDDDDDDDDDDEKTTFSFSKTSGKASLVMASFREVLWWRSEALLKNTSLNYYFTGWCKPKVWLTIGYAKVVFEEYFRNTALCNSGCFLLYLQFLTACYFVKMQCCVFAAASSIVIEAIETVFFYERDFKHLKPK